MKSFTLTLLIISSYVFSVACREKQDNEAATVAACDVGEDCFIRDEALNVANNSSIGGLVSHNQGQNCMACHQQNGPGKGLFTIAGTVFGTDLSTFTEGGTIRLFTDRMRTSEVYQFPIDKLGNFYSTEKLNMPTQGFYVSVFNSAGNRIKDMNSPKISLACNICHAGLASVVVQP